MDNSTVNVGFTRWHIRNRRVIPAGAKKEALPAPNGGLEVIWEIPNKDEGRDTFVSFIWDADGAPKRGSYQVVDWETDEIFNSGVIRSEDALVRVLSDVAA